MRARSRSTTRRVATLCTRPADVPRADAAERDVRHLVADEAVEDPATLLRLDQLHVEVAPVLDRLLDRVAGDLVEHHPLHRHVRLEHLEQVPRDGLALAVLVGREVELARVLQRRLELGDDVLLVVGDDVDRREVVVDVDAEAADLGLGDALRHLLGAVGQVADVADARHHRRSGRDRGSPRWSSPWPSIRRSRVVSPRLFPTVRPPRRMHRCRESALMSGPVCSAPGVGGDIAHPGPSGAARPGPGITPPGGPATARSLRNVSHPRPTRRSATTT